MFGFKMPNPDGNNAPDPRELLRMREKMLEESKRKFILGDEIILDSSNPRWLYDKVNVAITNGQEVTLSIYRNGNKLSEHSVIVKNIIGD